MGDCREHDSVSPEWDVPCLFPVLNSGYNPDEQDAYGSVPVHVESLDCLFDFCGAHAVSLSQLLQASWGILLQCYTGSDHVAFGYIDDSKPIEAHEEGHAVILRLDLADNPMLFSLIKAVANRENSSVFSVVSETGMGWPCNTAVMWNTSADCPIQYKIRVEVKYSEETPWIVSLVYCKSVLSECQAVAVAETLSKALSEIVRHSHIRDMNLSTDRDIQTLSQWNSRLPEFVETCAHELVLKQCNNRPEATAVCSWDGSWTYHELDNLSFNLAQHLSSRGIGPEKFVPLLFEKSKWTVISVLAVIRSGGAFALLDPSFPPSRLKYICQKLEATLILCSDHLADNAAALAGEVVPVSEKHLDSWLQVPDSYFESREEDDPRPIIKPQNALYAVFTSGTTGEPKGVVISHLSYCSGVNAHAHRLRLDATSRVLQFSSFAFDVSVLEILTTLIVGGCVCVISEAERRSNIPRAISELRVNYLLTTPTIAKLLRPEDTPSLKTLVLLGELLTPSIIASWTNCVNLTINSYGPAECTILSSAHDVFFGQPDERIIGSAVGALLWIVDPFDKEKLSPIGGVGELLIEGPIVGRGYINNFQATESAFIPGPPWRSAFPGSDATWGMYRTGDLVQYVGNGEMRFIGRRDAQVKFHGQRLELSEVEHHINTAFNGAKETVADLVIPSDNGGSSVLVGFVWAPASGRDQTGVASIDEHHVFMASSEEFRNCAQTTLSNLTGSLPVYMVPSVLIPLSYIPSTRTGKVDRQRLRKLCAGMTRPELESFTRGSVEGRLPDSNMERVLYQLIQDILGVSEFGMNDNFFSLGGDSVRGIELTRRAREAGYFLPGQDIFKKPILADLALLMSTNKPQFEVAPFSLMKDPGKKLQFLETLQRNYGFQAEDVEDIYPCTPLQEGMMALTHTSSDLSYVTKSVYRIPRGIVVERLKAAWDAVILSNAILRTRIVQIGLEQTYQVVLRSGISWDNADNLEDYLQRVSQIDMQHGDPLLRLSCKQNGGDQYLKLTIHHALYDGWSLPQILGQVEAAYYGEQPLSKPFNLFIDYIMSLNQTRMEEFWEGKLADFTGPMFPRAPSINYQPSSVSSRRCSLSGIQLVQNSGFTLATITQLAWAVTLSQYSSSDDVVFGLTLAGRNMPVHGIDEILGPTLTTVPLRVKLQPEAPVGQMLEELHRQSIEHLQFGYLGLQRISALGEGPAAACLFQSLLVIQPPPEDDASGIFSNIMKSHSTEMVDNYILTLEAKLGNEGVHLEAVYDTDVIPDTLMDWILNQFTLNVTEIIEGADKSLQELSSISTESLQQLQVWNNYVPVAIPCCVHDLIDRNSQAEPNTPAVDAWDGSLTYQELHNISSSLAAHMKETGIGPGDYVLLHLGKSYWTVVSMLAVMRVGAAFVLLDQSQPIARQQQIYRDTQASLVISSHLHVESALQLGVKLINVDQCKLPEVYQGFAPPVGPSSVVYAVFTSGSTGRPKGVVIEHGAFATSAIMNGSRQFIHRGSRVLQLAAFTFDSAIAEILYPLVHGATTCIPREVDCRNDLETTINKFNITWATATPSLARALTPTKITTLQTLALGGEALTSADVTMWAKHVQLVNGFGPSEGSVDSIIQPEVICGSDPANIGRGVAAVSWVVDPNNSHILRPLGAVGELLLEGPILAQGYMNDMEKTASSFIEYPDWLSSLRFGKSGRLYKTGDLVQYSPRGDGSIQYIGRKDNQTKLRGQRIELGEVEHHLRDCWTQSQEVIAEIVKPVDTGSHSVLVAFVLLGTQNVLSAGSSYSSTIIAAPDTAFRTEVELILSELRSRLPDSMVPTFVLPLTRVPLTPNGKLDRRFLREEASQISRKDFQSYSASESVKRQPSTREGIALHDAISTILKLPLEEIGMDDNFFHLGGDSITAMRIVGLLRESSLTCRVADIFNHPRLSELATMMCNATNDSTSESIPSFSLLNQSDRAAILADAVRQCEIEENLIQDIYPCTPMQEALFALSMKQQGDYVGNFEFQVSNAIDIDGLKSAWEAVFDANPILRTHIIHTGPTGHSFQVVLRKQLYWASDITPLQVKNGGLLVCFSTQQKEGGHIIHLRIHHALYDGVSMMNLTDQVKAAYNGNRLQSRPFNRFIASINNLDLRESEDFWVNEFSDLNAASFPMASTRLGSFKASRQSTFHTISLPPSSHTKFTIPTLIKFTCALMIGHYTASDDVVYGLTLTGRSGSVKEIDLVTGPTITTIPFRTRLPADGLVRKSLHDLQNHLSRLVPHEQIGLQKIRHLSPEAAAACNFQFQLIIQLDTEDQDEPSILFKEVSHNEDEYSQFSSYPLVVICTVSSDKRRVTVASNFDTAHYSEMEATAWSNQFEHVLQQIAQDEDRLIRGIEVASPQDLSRLSEYNPIIPGSNQLIHDLIFQQCDLQPSAMAVCAWDGHLSYGELRYTSLQLAKYFTTIGVESHQVITVYMEKSHWVVAVILSILLTGCTCALIDSSHPPGRMREIVQQTSSKFTVVSPATKSKTKGVSSNIVEVSSTLLETLPTSEYPLAVGIDSTEPAFIFFTSGSTGKPKGIVLEHGSITTSLRNLQPCIQLSMDARVLQFSSYAFDISVMEILGSLIFGSTLFVPSEFDRINNLAGFIRDHDVNWSSLTPSTANLLSPADIPSLRTLVLGGEPLTSNIVDKWAGHILLIHVYGPAECCFANSSSPVPATGWVPGTIGPMVSGAGWITSPSDPHKLAAWGAVGELLIEGPILAREYVGDPEKTQESFIPSPSWLTQFRGPGHRKLYRTGDLVHYTTDGSIRYVGRKDRQVKLAGQRIEPSEIENQIRQCFPWDIVVVVELVTANRARPSLFAFISLGENTNGCLEGEELEGRLVFTTPKDDFLSLVGAVRSRLFGILPRYMVPSSFIQLNYTPLTPTGKINRKLLCSLAASLEPWELDQLTLPSIQRRAPTTPMELQVTTIWAETFNIPAENISSNDNFFNLGGDSILAMKFISAARAKGLVLTIADIFSHPHLSDMATVATSEVLGTETIAVDPFSLVEANARDVIQQAASDQCSVGRELIEDIYPCTPMQEGLLSLSMKTQGAYLGSFRYSLPIDMDLNLFQMAWSTTANANPILRTRIIQHNSVFQVIINEDLRWDVVDNFDEHFSSLSDRNFLLGQPLVHLAITKRRNKCPNEFSLVIHHALYDGWSLPLILNQVQQAYDGHRLSPRPFNQFVDHLERTDPQSSKTYWETELANSNSMVFPPLPSPDYTPSGNATIEKTVNLVPPPGVMKATVVQLAWALALSQYTGCSDILFGLVSSGRKASLGVIDSVTGPTITTVPVRFCFQGKNSVYSELRRLQEQLTGMIPFEQFGLQRIRQQLGNQADEACQFQNLLVIQPPEAEDKGIFLTPVNEARNVGAFSIHALEATCEVSDLEVKVTFDFDNKVIEEQQAERVLSHFMHTIQQVQSISNKNISELGLLGHDDSQETLQWNAVAPVRLNCRVHDGIQQVCLKQPDAPAVRAWDGDFTYGKLDELSSKLACHLELLGVGPEIFVPVCAEKSCWVAVSILGIIKAGGAITLLDPSVPIHRLQTICQDVNAQVIISSTQCAELSSRLASTVVIVDRKHVESYVDESVYESNYLTTPNNALYAVFTSGSTGTPKGIVTEHAAFYTSAMMQKEPLYLDSGVRKLQFSSHMFDVSISDYLCTFMTGGCVCIPRESGLKDDISSATNQFGINYVDITPSVARLLRPEDIPCVTVVILGGEPISQHDIDTWAGNVKLVGAYGPAEASITCTFANMRPQSNCSNIGRTSGTVSWVVDKDDHQRLIPIGAIGELVIEGHTLARGYLNNREKDAESFITAPAWLRGLRPNSRLYKTGDLVKYNNDGSLRYVGRKDTQVKIRGQRVELGEVEHHVRQSFPCARDVVAELISTSDGKAETILAAFVHTLASTGNGETDNMSSLFQAANPEFVDKIQQTVLGLRNRLPVYMVPSVFFPLRYVPLSPTGKADRRVLCQEVASLSRTQLAAYFPSGNHKQPPTTSAERIIQLIVSNILQLETSQVGLNDDFFALGGDSIIAIRLVENCREHGFSFRVADVFKNPKLSHLALFVSDTLTDSNLPEIAPSLYLGFARNEDLIQTVISSRQLPFARENIKEILPVSEFGKLFLRRPATYWTLNLEGQVDHDQLAIACARLVQRHGTLRTVFVPHEDKILQVVLKHFDPHIQQCKTGGAIQDFIDNYCRDDIMDVPLFDRPITQFSIVTGAGGKHALTLKIHHAQWDGYSLHILWRDLKSLYESQSLPEATQFSAHTQQWIKAQNPKAFTYWKNVLDGSRMSVIGNHMFGNQKNSSNIGAEVGQYVTSSKLIEEGTALPPGLTTATLVKAAWSFLLSCLTRQDDVTFMQMSNGRNHGSKLTKDLVGLCLNPIPVRAKLDPRWTALDLIQFLQDQHRESIEFELLDFSQIVERSSPWPKGTRYQSTVLHQNIEEHVSFRFGESEGLVSCSYWPLPPDPIIVQSLPIGDGLEISLDTTSDILSQVHVEFLVEKLCDLIVLFSNSPDQRLSELDASSILGETLLRSH